MSENPWLCVRQRAGPLVKECRSIRPRLSADDSPWDRAEKNKILLPPRDSSVCRTPVDRLELRLALFGYEGTVYCLTFDDTHLPPSWPAVRKVWKSFLYRLKRWRGECFDYIYLIEGRHGAHRYHIHLVLRDSDFSPAEIRHLWTYGEEVDDEPLLRGDGDSYRRMAKYFNKEATDGVTIPIGAKTWVCSRSLLHKLPETEVWRSSSGSISVPPSARINGAYFTTNEFGAYHYAWYIERDQRFI